ncbi:MAG: transglycosylase domain-containing protein [Alphaproteobacteria bacterium]|nr:transglycosylase domain-containing protein [Alphaproteobacteria bacterium]
MPPPRVRRRPLRTLLIAATLLGLAAGGVTAFAYHRLVVADPGDHLARAYVRSVIAQESPVFYRDGRTRLGVFFEDEHRDYVPFDRLPRAYVAAIVAAEDDGFWRHAGIDPVHVARAALDNLSAGRLVAGGSTLTQQTAKNLFHRPDRSLQSKLREALDALRLEHHYGKAEILELYANQFHVSGNGRGIGIAARHFFDREVADLGVLECAFLAGVVKAPTHYDPFLGDEARRERAVARATDRTRYVLRRLVGEPAARLAGPEPDGSVASLAAHARRIVEVEAVQAQARRLLEEGFTLPFVRGRFRYESSAVVDEVGRRLAEPPFDTALSRAGVEDPAGAGLQVITTLDPGAQRAAVYGLWHHLTEVGTQLEGLGHEDFLREEDEAPRFDPDHAPRAWEFRTARVVELVEDQGRQAARLDLGGHACLLDRDALVRVAVQVARGRAGSPSAKVPSAEVDALAEGLVGRVVWVSVREVTDEGARCDLEVRPALQGAAVVLRDGEILGMVGGNDNRNFNRATALRQLGSTWKTVVLHAALELGWRPDEPLDNRRNVFPFSTTAYWPSPDHQGEPEVSLAWAGVRSENLATVWLLYHLLDRLDDDAIGALAAALDLAPREGEDRAAFALRVQQAGILPTPGRVQEGIYLRARQEVLATPEALRHPEDALTLQSTLHGWGFEAEARRVDSAWQREVLGQAWIRLVERRGPCGEAWRTLRAALELGLRPPSGAWPDLRFRRDEAGEIRVGCGRLDERWGPLESVAPPLIPTEVAETMIVAFAPDLTVWPDEADLLIEGRLHAATIDAVADAIERRELTLELSSSERDLYGPELLHAHQDFRVLLGLRYVARLAARLGVRTGIQEVLSLPLGASEITLEEAAMLYDGLTTGRTWAFPGLGGTAGPLEAPPASTLLVRAVRDDRGTPLYRAAPREEQVTSDEVGALTADILRLVVEEGTGRRARGAVKVAGEALPLGGKTGTTNDFRNAAFVGIAPVVEQDVLAGEIVIAVYVGYDDNRSMSRKGITLAGASGALPAWTTIARGLAAAGLLGPPESRPPASGWSRPVPDGLATVEVDSATGLPVDGDGEPPRLLTPVRLEPPPAEPLADALASPPRPVRIAPRGPGDQEAHGLWRRRAEDPPAR